MPGILPMKVIKIGTSAQSRIAQACDRCRSKKIRCDGLRPCCTQCSSVGFECKTSDKLSRRAFPRGYTESLEERVRALETEVKELKNLLDEKDEKIEMLSKMSSQSPRRSSTTPSAILPSTTGSTVAAATPEAKDTFKMLRPHSSTPKSGSTAYYTGSSSARAFVEVFGIKVQETGRSYPGVNPDELLVNYRLGSTPKGLQHSDTPPRLLSDQMVNIFLQEWSPLFPVLHRPTFLAHYEEYVSSNADTKDEMSIAMLNLVFGIAALSSERRLSYDVSSFEARWIPALDSCATKSTLENLQCLVLAQIFYLQKGDYSRLLQYKGMAIGMAQQLGLHTSQKQYTLNALQSETRKKVFWTLYTLDCFSATALGLPTLLRDDDIECEYPVDADDENVTRKGFRPGNPGESTKLSSALAVFRGARILSKVLEQCYSTAASQGLSLQTVASLGDELDQWNNNLAPHLKLEFVQDKPCTNVISSRCPLISLTYHYIRSLIHRPAVCSNLRDRASSSTVTLASSSKRIVQILELLEERNLSFSFCLNKTELLITSGLGLLIQAMNLNKASKLMQDSQKTTQTIVKMLERDNVPGAAGFKQVASLLDHSVPVKREASIESPTETPQGFPTLPAHLGFAQKHLQAIAARYTLSTNAEPKQRPAKDLHRASAPTLPISKTQQNLLNAQNYASQTTARHAAPQHSRTIPSTQYPMQRSAHSAPSREPIVWPSPASVNLDYFVFPEEFPAPKHTRQPDLPFTEFDPLFDTTQISPEVDNQDFSYLDTPGSSLGHDEINADDAILESLGWPPMSWETDMPASNSMLQHYPDSLPSLSSDSFSEERSSSGRNSIGCEDAFAAITIPDFSVLEGRRYEGHGYDNLHDSLTF